MRIRRNWVRTTLVVTLALVIGACQSDPGPTSPAIAASSVVARSPFSGALLVAPELADSILEVRVDPSRHFAEPLLSDAELVSAVQAAGGIVAIGFKSERAQLSG